MRCYSMVPLGTDTGSHPFVCMTVRFILLVLQRVRVPTCSDSWMLRLITWGARRRSLMLMRSRKSRPCYICDCLYVVMLLIVSTWPIYVAYLSTG